MKKAIIIGAGPAGLTAAYKLLKETDIKPINQCGIGFLFGADERKRSCDKGGH